MYCVPSVPVFLVVFKMTCLVWLVKTGEWWFYSLCAWPRRQAWACASGRLHIGIMHEGISQRGREIHLWGLGSL